MNINRVSQIILIFSLVLTGSLAKAQTISIIPKPVSLTPHPGNFTIDKSTNIKFDPSNEDLAQIAKFIQDDLREYYHVDLTANNESPKAIKLQIDPSLKLGNEGYAMTVNADGIQISAPAPNGVFYGVQTLKQLLPAQPVNELSVPFVEIQDQPRFKWRGMMLDVSRHFYPVFYIKKLLDNMALFKLNTFHWHLTDDQGWRIEIKKYPKLTETSSWRNQTVIGHNTDKYDGAEYGGFYTQDQVREIVKYAADRYITIVPEIEMPGHSSAALAAYPEIGCTGGPYQVATRWGIFTDVYCAGKESTFQFLEEVLDEVCSLFPSKYIHVGGDECPKDAWKQCPDCQQRIKDEGLKDEHELQSYFIRRIEKYLNSKGRKLIGWDEILEGGIAPEATVMSWRGVEGGIEAAKLNHDVVMTPTTNCYFDFYQSKNKDSEPLAQGGYLPLEKVYNYEPIPAELDQQEAKHILGAQANVWTEYISNIPHLEYMIFPRLCALSEVVWSPKDLRNFTDFESRMEATYPLLKFYHINYCDHSY